jgi:hypothetical protein
LYPSDLENQPPLEQDMSLRRLVQDARGRLGPGADVSTILDDLRARGLDVSRADLTRVWDDVA